MYVVPLIEPPPLTIDQVPPAGVPVNSLVAPEEILAVVVVFEALVTHGVTVKLTVSEVSAQEPSAAIVYLISTVVFEVTSAGV